LSDFDVTHFFLLPSYFLPFLLTLITNDGNQRFQHLQGQASRLAIQSISAIGR